MKSHGVMGRVVSRKTVIGWGLEDVTGDGTSLKRAEMLTNYMLIGG